MAKKVEIKPAALAAAEPSVVMKPKVAKPKTTPESSVKSEPLVVTNEMIAERAYHKWKNGEPGDEHHHWTTSERELRGQG